MKADERIIQVLKSARALIEQGWCQNDSFLIDAESGQCSYCASGALWAVKEDQSFFYAVDALSKVIDSRKSFVPGRDSNLNDYASRVAHWNADPTWMAQWNDHPDRTQADVLAAFDDAIAMVVARSKEFPSEI